LTYIACFPALLSKTFPDNGYLKNYKKRETVFSIHQQSTELNSPKSLVFPLAGETGNGIDHHKKFFSLGGF